MIQNEKDSSSLDVVSGHCSTKDHGDPVDCSLLFFAVLCCQSHVTKTSDSLSSFSFFLLLLLLLRFFVEQLKAMSHLRGHIRDLDFPSDLYNADGSFVTTVRYLLELAPALAAMAPQTTTNQTRNDTTTSWFSRLANSSYVH